MTKEGGEGVSHTPQSVWNVGVGDGGEEVVEVGGSVEGGSTGGIYRGSGVEQCGIYRWVGSVWWSVDRVGSIIYIEGPRGIYNRVL